MDNSFAITYLSIVIIPTYFVVHMFYCDALQYKTLVEQTRWACFT